MELAPGFYVDSWLPPGKVYRFREGVFPVFPSQAVALNPRDWERIPGADRERLLDELTRSDAARGQRLIEQYLEKAEGAH